MTIDEWVHRLNALGADLDDMAAAMHPSAWHDALAQESEKWRKLAAITEADDDDKCHWRERRLK